MNKVFDFKAIEEKRGDMTLQEWYAIWLFEYKKVEYKGKSFQKYEGIYKNYVKDTEIGITKLRDLKVDDFEKYYAKLATNKPESTIFNIHSRIRPCVEAAKNLEYITKNHCAMVSIKKTKPEKKVIVLSKSEEAAFIKAIKGHELELFFLLSLSAGLKVSELIALRWSNFNFTNNTVKVESIIQSVTDVDIYGKRSTKRVESPGNSSVNRAVPVPGKIMRKLKEFQLNQNIYKSNHFGTYIDKNFVFTDEKGNPYSEKKPNVIVNKIMSELGVDNITYTSLVYTYAARLFEANLDYIQIKKYLGYSYLETVMELHTKMVEDGVLCKDSDEDMYSKINKIFSYI